MTVSIALKKTISRPSKPPSPLWIPAIGLSLISTAYTSASLGLCLVGSFATFSPINAGMFIYAGYSVVKAFKNLAASCESVLNHYIPDTTIPLTPTQSMARSFNAIAHASIASAVNNLSMNLQGVRPDYQFLTRDPASIAIYVIFAIGGIGLSKALGSGDDNDKKPPKNGPKP